jgi:hypothetical protein
MNTTGDLFALNMNSKGDICANRHKGARTSVEAHKRIRGGLQARREAVYAMIEKSWSRGITLDEVAFLTDTTPNAISGRFTELARDGRIVKCGRRKTRSGCSAVVWKAK